MATEIKYNDSVIATPEAGQTAVLRCKGKVMDGDLVVNVEAPNLQEKTVTENGEVVADEGYDGLSKVTVEVESSGDLTINGIIEQYKVNAGATVNAGDFVEFVTKFGGGEFANTSCSYVCARKLGNDKVLVAYSDAGNNYYGKAIVLTIDGTTITKGATTILNSGQTRHVSTAVLTDSKVLVAYQDSGNSKKGTAIVLTIDGTTITKGTASVFESGTTTYISSVALTEDKVLVAYRDEGNSNKGTAVVLTTSGTTITAGTATVFESGATTYISAVALTDSKVLVAYQDGGNSEYGTAVVLTISGTTITAGTAKVFESGSTQFISSVALTEDKVLVAYEDCENSYYGTAVVLTTSGTTITAGTATVFESAETNYTSTVALTEDKVLVAYQDCKNHNYGTVVVLNIDGTTITAGTATVFDYDNVSYSSPIAFSETSVFVAYNNSLGLYSSLAIDETTITADSSENATFVQPANSRLHNVGVAMTSGAEGEMVDVYVVG